ncbi:hypothetical protein Esi_0098_0047 [Ectocarpus siliculosus]|uniref:Uncharacterized protein n=1 Tax=Ectocarpus siliculosus TaxID=2880 RepID=D7G9G2_ECTSI|nr:hypothetical protein Esi_0098_0047 [Ectocarpus siliculosus]|eukprot:CBJ28302.1 hypothetical protein Esi_0098_0047 [Ectocarpus siliculosus]
MAGQPQVVLRVHGGHGGDGEGNEETFPSAPPSFTGATSDDIGEIGEPEVGVRVQLRPGPLHAVLDVGSSRLGGQAAGRQRPTAGQRRTATATAALHAPAQDRWY